MDFSEQELAGVDAYVLARLLVKKNETDLFLATQPFYFSIR